MIRRMARIGIFTLLFVSLTIIARAQTLPDIMESLEARACSYAYPTTTESQKLYMAEREKDLSFVRAIARDNMLCRQDTRVTRDNRSFDKIVAFLQTITPGVTNECSVFLVMGEPDHEIDTDTFAGFWSEGRGKWSTYYVGIMGYPQPAKGQKLIAKRFFFSSAGRPAHQMLDVLMTVEKSTHTVVDYAFYFRNGITPEYWEEAMLASL